MKIFHLNLFILFIVANFQTSAIAQMSSAKPKIASKSVTYSSKKTTEPAVKAAKIHFDNLTLDLGTIKEDAVIERSFEFINVGVKDLVVINAKGSCGCTIPTVPLQPIAPGGKGKIVVKYTAKNKVGPQKPVITVTTNGIPSIVKLNLEAWVEQIPGGVK